MHYSANKIAHEPNTHDRSRATSSSTHILLIDQNDELRGFVRACLTEHWRVNEVTGVRSALRWLRKMPQRNIAIVGTLPKSEADVLGEALRSMHATRTLVLRATSGVPAWAEATLQHPFTATDLREAVTVLEA